MTKQVAPPEKRERGIVVLWFTLPAFPAVAAFSTVTAYIAQGDRLPGWVHDDAFLVGTATALLAWVVLSLLFLHRYVDPRLANTRVYDDICERYEQLDARLSVLCQANQQDPGRCIACVEALTQRDGIAAELTSTGLRWAQGSGYINLWNRIHRAEEALIAIEDTERVAADALQDKLRLDDSGIANTEQLRSDLQRAILVLSPSAAQYAGFGPAPMGITPGEPAGSVAEARAILRAVRHTINVYRDDRRDGLVRVRNQLIGTGAFTSLVAYVLVGFATLIDVPWQAVGSMATFYIVGAIIGLFSRLGAEAEAEAAVEDYGLSRARLFHTPLFSGLAAVGGVVITLSLYNVLHVGGPTQQPEVPLVDIFDLNKNRQGLAIAAVFGLTPSLLVRRLQEQTDTYKQELSTSEAASSSRAGRA
jgi:hypothetical protein